MTGIEPSLSWYHSAWSGGGDGSSSRLTCSKRATSCPRAPPRSFHTHHLRLLSLTIASALAQSFDDHADALNSQLIDGDLDLGQPNNGRTADG